MQVTISLKPEGFGQFFGGSPNTHHHLVEFCSRFGCYNLPRYHAQNFNMEPKNVGLQQESPFLREEFSGSTSKLWDVHLQGLNCSFLFGVC